MVAVARPLAAAAWAWGWRPGLRPCPACALPDLPPAGPPRRPAAGWGPVPVPVPVPWSSLGWSRPPQAPVFSVARGQKRAAGLYPPPSKAPAPGDKGTVPPLRAAARRPP